MAHPSTQPKAGQGARRGALAALLALACALAAVTALPQPTRADIQVDNRKDTVTLQDGTTIECVVLIVTPEKVLIVVPDPDDPEGAPIQKVIPRAQIKEIVRGQTQMEVKGFQTDGELAKKVIKGSGFREVKKKKEGPLIPAGKTKLEDLEPVVLPSTVNPGGPAVNNTKLTPKQVAEAYMNRFPELRDGANRFLGGERQLESMLDKAMKGSPQTRQQVEGLLNLFLQGGASGRAQPAAKVPPGTAPQTGVRPAVPAPPQALAPAAPVGGNAPVQGKRTK